MISQNLLKNIVFEKLVCYDFVNLVFESNFKED